MEYYYYAILSFLLLLFCGLPFCIAFLPSALKKYSLVFAPSFGYCYVVFASYYLYRLNVPGADVYAFAVLALPLVFQLLYSFSYLKSPGEMREFINFDTGIVYAITALGFAVVSVPFLVKQGSPISLAMSNLDIAELACVSRFLQEFSRNSLVGFLGQSGHFVWTCDDVWFGPSAIVAFTSTILGSEPYKLQSLVMNVLACQGISFIYLLARKGLGFQRVSAIVVMIMYALNPVVIYTIWQSFGAQMITMPLLVAIILLHTFALNRVTNVKDYHPFIPSIIFVISGILLTYHFMTVILIMLLGFYTLVHYLIRKRFSFGLRLVTILGLSYAFCFLLNPFRLRSIISTLSIVTSNNGWFIPWLSPDILLGANSANAFVRRGLLNNEYAWLLLAGIAFLVSVYHGLKSYSQNNHLSFILGLFLPVFLLGLYFAITGMQDGRLGSYRSFKITSIYCAITLLTLFLYFATPSWRNGRIKFIFGCFFFLIFTLVSALNVLDLVSFTKANAFVMPDEVAELKKIESFPFVKGINVMDSDNFLLLWINYFTMKKPQVYQRFPYGGRPVGILNQDFYLASNSGSKMLSQAPDIFQVETESYEVKYDINKLFSIYRSAVNQDVTISLGEGWWGKEPTHRWSGSKGRTCSIFVDSRTAGVRIKIEAHFMTLLTGNQLSVLVNGNPVTLSHTSTTLETQPFSLREGRNVVEFITLLDPDKPPPHDPRTLNIAWKEIIVKFPSTT